MESMDDICNTRKYIQISVDMCCQERLCWLLEQISRKEFEEACNLPGLDGLTTLCNAVSLNGHEEEMNAIVKMLLEHGADASVKDHYGLTPLHIAASKEDARMLEIILEQRPTMVDIRSSFNETPLHAAIRSGSASCVNLLLSYNADCTIMDSGGNNAFHVAAYAAIPHSDSTNKSIISMLKKCPSIAIRSVRNYRGWTPGDILNMVPSVGVFVNVKENLLSMYTHCPRYEPGILVNDIIINGIKEAKESGLIDAVKAGSNEWYRCTLILTEGISAKMFSRAGISSVHVNGYHGNDYYGVYPLNGKLVNIRGQNPQKITNKKVYHIASVLGLEIGVRYNPKEPLRYGCVLIITDQDSDGCHIKGLVINMFQCLWPNILRNPLFLRDMTTSIIKAKTACQKEQSSFKSIQEFQRWRKSDRWQHCQNVSGWEYKYYKGVGRNENYEAQEYFNAMRTHSRHFYWRDHVDDVFLDKAFNKKRSNERKIWIVQNQKCLPALNYKDNLITVGTFINTDLIRHFVDDTRRSIPSVVDGLKPSQRKILYSVLESEIVGDIKVFDLAGVVSRKTSYHHRATNLEASIITMAQDFVGCNNINLLEPRGQFGSRNEGGHDHKTSFYISTGISPIAPIIFPKEDYSLLNYLNEDGMNVEPEWYCPIIPMILVNGSIGISTGYSTTVPSHNPIDIIKNIRLLMEARNLNV